MAQTVLVVGNSVKAAALATVVEATLFGEITRLDINENVSETPIHVANDATIVFVIPAIKHVICLTTEGDEAHQAIIASGIRPFFEEAFTLYGINFPDELLHINANRELRFNRKVEKKLRTLATHFRKGKSIKAAS
ncbi:hypothetical protein [Shouchella tritolerans]|uniref:hypothetical protein n=1 Tax=Shouchella tritolerans TaxID=2979466 RepID=UPI0021E839C8|nr:hypothetical protein [Shouchella tritolerans]